MLNFIILVGTNDDVRESKLYFFLAPTFGTNDFVKACDVELYFCLLRCSVLVILPTLGIFICIPKLCIYSFVVEYYVHTTLYTT